mmetsp:Transcript_5182/g.5312  ORF Transcript_5182/g.5312 Transcript_5182/m.5312 type:complete len:110 (+) Transcript_5182:149-478(+)
MKLLGKKIGFLQNSSNNSFWEHYSHDIMLALQEKKTFTTTVVNFRKNGQTFPSLMCLNPIYNIIGECEYIAVVHFDCLNATSNSEGVMVLANELMNSLMQISCGTRNSL